MKERRGRKFTNPDSQFVVHPDNLQAFANYNGTDNSFKNMLDERKRRIQQGDKYWNDLHDEEMKDYAQRASQEVRNLEHFEGYSQAGIRKPESPWSIIWRIFIHGFKADE